MKYRQCLVNGKKALFHMWANKDMLQFRTTVVMNRERLKQLDHDIFIKGTRVIPNFMEPIHHQLLVGVVELESGDILEVDPKEIKFIDSGQYFKSHDWSYFDSSMIEQIIKDTDCRIHPIIQNDKISKIKIMSHLRPLTELEKICLTNHYFGTEVIFENISIKEVLENE